MINLTDFEEYILKSNILDLLEGRTINFEYSDMIYSMRLGFFEGDIDVIIEEVVS